MSKGYIHTTATLVMAAEMVIVAAFNLNPSDVEYALGALIGTVVTPDLDVDHGRVVAYKIIKQRLGALPYRGWQTVWYIYRKSVRHGSALSHFPVVGTLGREVYLFLAVVVLPTAIIAPVLHLDFWGEVQWWAWYIIEHYKVHLGLMAADFIHWILDVATTEHRRTNVYNTFRKRDTGQNG